MINSVECRLRLLAGIIDSDGHLAKNVYYISQKHKVLADQIVQVANSLGFRSYLKIETKRISRVGFKGDYCNITISGAIDRIPVRLKRKRAVDRSERFDRRNTGFRIEKSINDCTIALSIDQDNCFLLADGTIVGGDGYTAPKLESYLVNKRESLWDEQLKALTEFIKQRGRYPSLTRTGTEKLLACWLQNVRARYRIGTLPSHRLDKLTTHGITMVPSLTRQDEYLELIRVYTHLHKRPPGYFTIFHGIKIGRWWSRYKKKIHPTLVKSILGVL